MKEPALPCPGIPLTGLQVAAFSVKLKATSARILRNLELMLGGTTLRIRNNLPTNIPTYLPTLALSPCPSWGCMPAYYQAMAALCSV